MTPLNLPGAGRPLDTYDREHGHFPVLCDADELYCSACGPPDTNHKYCHEGRPWKSNTFTVRERVMLFFMNQITDKPGWEDKVFDPAIVDKWNKEALAIDKEVFDMFLASNHPPDGGEDGIEDGDEVEGDGDEDDREEEDGDDDDADDDSEDDAQDDIEDNAEVEVEDDHNDNDDEDDDEEEDEDDGEMEEEDDDDDEANGAEDAVSAGERPADDASDNEAMNENGDTSSKVDETRKFKNDGEGFSQAMFDWCIRELQSKAKLMKESGIVAVLDGAAAVFKSDVAVDETLRADLCAAAAPLENGDKDWHPGSDGKVLDLVHPSLWPLVYGRTRVTNKAITIDNCLQEMRGGDVLPTPAEPKNNQNPTRYSTKFQWLPSEVEIGPDGPRFTSYINNLHPVEHKELYPVLERLLGCALPPLSAAYDRVMAWQKVDTLPVPDDYKAYTGDGTSIQPLNRIIALWDNRECLVPHLCKGSYGCGPDNYYTSDNENDDDDDEQWEGWYDRTHPPRGLPPRDPYIDVGVTSIRAPDWKNIQVIVKLANIHLTPEKPTYDGGSWHVEGLWNEHIVATALYYYDSDNITDSYLGFRTEVDAERMQQMTYDYPQYEHGGFEAHYGVQPGLGGDEDGLTQQFLGQVRTNQGRLLVFPNVLQHRVSPFELVDKSRPGHRKIVAFFLVDPTTKVVSTANVPPQQQHWAPPTHVDTLLPVELSNMIAGHIGCPFDFETAAKLREELMDERRAPNGNSAAIPHPAYYSFCEH